MAPVTDERQRSGLREPPSWRRAKSRIATALMVFSFVLVMIPLGFVLVTVIAKGASAISWSFSTLSGSLSLRVESSSLER